MDFKDLLVAAYNEPDPRPFLFEVGQKVRVLDVRVDQRWAGWDGQTKAYWNGAVVEVLSRKSTGLHKDHFYCLKHENGAIDDFREEELDGRFRKRKNK